MKNMQGTRKTQQASSQKMKSRRQTPESLKKQDNPQIQNISSEDMKFMRQALHEAKKAVLTGDVPIGAVIVRDGKVIARGRNTKERHCHSLKHAECNAIDRATKKLGAWRLEGCTLYVTLEPCPMCAGAIHQSRMDRVVFGAFDQKHGACGSRMNLFAVEGLNHYPVIDSGVLEQECSEIIRKFFMELRQNKRTKNEKM